MRALSEEEVQDLANRINKAAFSLGQLARSNKGRSREELERLRGKREGVLLVLGYLKETARG